MTKGNYLYTVYNGYTDLGTVKTLAEARKLAEDTVKQHNLRYKQIVEIRSEVTDIEGETCKAWHITYQYQTLYFETFLIIGRCFG